MKINYNSMVNMSLSDEDYLFKLAEMLADWAQNFSNVSFRNFPEKPLVDLDRKSTRLNSSHIQKSRMPSSA